MSATRQISSSTFGAIGFGAMGISAFYGEVEPDEERFKVLDAAHASGCTFWDSADVYMDSEELIGKWFQRTGKRVDIFLCTKFGFVRETLDTRLARVCTRCGGVQPEASLRGPHMHRADSTTVRAMAELVREGKVKHLGLSEYSPFTLDIEDPKIALLRTARELGVKIVAYSPLGRGLLTSHIRSPDDLAPDDFRRQIPRYSASNFPDILHVVDSLKSIGCTCMIACDIIPIPGTKKIKYLEENLAASSFTLSAEDVAAVREWAIKADAAGQSAGLRYPPEMWKHMFVETPADASESAAS
ncbi:Major facilitator superfamily transporter [Mycena chlorophos]|uniref:Major facilitator superfamily transporter n=1 Tax=Mycena chlorophos TaxID=658473 RepID=A0A8H6VQX1_MYCCL|nr:Major facilitator superfamily transporter [Mycena chlorophos]